MSNLKIMDLCQKVDNKKIEKFNENINSNLELKIDYNKKEYDEEWIEIMEDTIKYLDNILRNPNRFIVNEEDVIKIELARRVTVESIKHLSRNTNLIQDIDKKTGDVRPSKILNINKEESYDTYENKFIYSLIQNMKSYINRKKSKLDSKNILKDNKLVDYTSSSKLGAERVNLSLKIETNIEQKSENDELLKRIEILERKIDDLTYNDVYKTIDKKHITLITSPIKKTNLIMKNVNFQYATKLWDYLQNHIEDDRKEIKKDEVVKDDIDLKKYFDELFLLSYLALKNPDEEQMTDTVATTMVKTMMELNKDISEQQLSEIVSKQYNKIKNLNSVNEKEIRNKFKTSIDRYLDKIKNVKV